MAGTKAIKLTRDSEWNGKEADSPSTIYVFDTQIEYIEQQDDTTGSIVGVGHNTFYVKESPKEILNILQYSGLTY
jgi:hypothetical protein